MGSIDGNNTEVGKKRKHRKNLFGCRDIYKSTGIRCGLCVHYKTDRKLLTYRRYILWGSAILFWTLFFTLP